ncbi:interactor of HORMAD1 protein 1 [Ammospiza caudacuta]|uniref:interactor of HORMAD1 protein 1 n=1 Tax=Ammospiza caudacuta TaxID=2857398 RepID=UPI002739FF60|nr:interactor of HORMAD1 protein 1 [Ammospiza caudacuta]
MNFNVWNIKEMLSTPTALGPNKFSMRSSTASDYSSLSDSQLLFGSQFCLENAQSAAAPLELGTQLGQQNSQDSEPSIFTKYQTKPQLFDEETREKGSLNFGAGRAKSVLENFEVNKNKIKDKYDREVLSTFISSIKDKLQELPVCFEKFEEMLDSKLKSSLVGLETLFKTLEDALQSHCSLVLKALTEKSQMEQALLEMERRLAAKDAEILDMKSSMQMLKEGLESLPAQLNEQFLKACKELGFLTPCNASAGQHTLLSSASLAPHTTDKSFQTSPGLCQYCVLMGQQNRASPGGNQLTGDGTSKGDLNPASEDKASPIATAACGTANTFLQEVKCSLETQSCAAHPCLCWAGRHFLGSSQKKQCPVPLEGPLPTPLRKAFRRGTRGFKPLTLSQQQQPQVCHHSTQKATPGQRHSNRLTNHEVEKAAVGNKTKLSPGRMSWKRAIRRKTMYSTKGKGERSGCADSGLKQRKATGIIDLESSRKNTLHSYLVDLNSENSDLVFAAPHQQILSNAQMGLTKNFTPVPHSDKSLQQPESKRKRSLEIKKTMNVSSIKRYLLDSSPEENVLSLCSTTGVQQMSCFSLQSPSSSKKPHPVNPQAQQKTACCSLLCVTGIVRSKTQACMLESAIAQLEILVSSKVSAANKGICPSMAVRMAAPLPALLDKNGRPPQTFLRTLLVDPTALSLRLPPAAAGPASAGQPCPSQGQHPPSAAPPRPDPRNLPRCPPESTSRRSCAAENPSPGAHPNLPRTELSPADPLSPVAGPADPVPAAAPAVPRAPPSRCGRAPVRVPAARGGA